MNQEASTSLPLRIWERATYLSRAPLFFAPKELKQAHDEAHAISAIETFSEETERLAKDGPAPAGSFQHVLMKVSSITNRKAKVRTSLETLVSHHLKSGSLIGYGFEPPRRMDSQPTEIPRGCWHGKIDWWGSKLSGESLEFVEVRVLAPKRRDAVVQDASDQFTQTRPPGRPGVGTAIEAAFGALLSNGEIDKTASQSSHYPNVRKWLAINTTDLSTPADKISDKTLYKYFSPLFKAL